MALWTGELGVTTQYPIYDAITFWEIVYNPNDGWKSPYTAGTSYVWNQINQNDATKCMAYIDSAVQAIPSPYDLQPLIDAGIPAAVDYYNLTGLTTFNLAAITSPIYTDAEVQAMPGYQVPQDN